MRDLFSSGQQFEKLPIPDADVSILRDLETHSSHEFIFRNLLEHSKWQQMEMNIYGKKVLQPRLTAWYGDQDRSYVYSGIKNIPLPWTDLLRELKRRIEDCTDAKFNSVLLNYYRNNNDSMGFHSDDERELGPEPTIASLSLGDRRNFIFKHKTNKMLEPFSIPLSSGSVLLMRGATQKNYKHAINRETRSCGPRINLTFRRIYNKAELAQLKVNEFVSNKLGN